MSKITNDLNSIGWSDRFALIDAYSPTDEQVCSTLGVTPAELKTARELRASGNFSNSNLDVAKYASLFGGTSSSTSITKPQKASGSSTATSRDGNAPLTASPRVKEPKKRGRKGSKIATAFAAIPSQPVSVAEFIAQHNVSVAVLRQSKRFDTTGISGAVCVKKDKDTKELMIWREEAGE